MSAATKAGDILTKRDGSRVQGPAMSFSAQFWIYEAGVATVNYEDDEDAALEHYDRLVQARRLAMGNTTAVLVH